MASTGMEEFIETPMLLLQCGVALAVPAVLTAIVNLGCGKKRDQPVRPGAKGGLSKAKPGAAAASSKSAKSKRSTKSAASTKSGKKGIGGSSVKDGKSKRSSKSIDKSGKSSKSGKKSKKSSKGSKSSKSKKSKRDLKQQKTGPPSDACAAAKQPPSTQTALVIDADKRSAELAGKRAAAAMAHEMSAKSAATQMSSSQRSSQRPATSGAIVLDENANAIGRTTLVSLNAGEATRELKMEPAELRWSSAGGMQKISLLNQSTERQAIKVKCSDNNVYRVNPVYAIVEPGQTLNVDVMRQNGSNKVDKIVFVTTRAGLEENPKNLFKPGTQSSMMVLPLLAATELNPPALAAAN